jgi:hypothetical protein
MQAVTSLSARMISGWGMTSPSSRLRPAESQFMLLKAAFHLLQHAARDPHLAQIGRKLAAQRLVQAIG